MQTQKKPEVSVLAPYGKKGLTQRGAVSTANEKKLVIANCVLHDNILVKTDEWRSINKVYPAWVGNLGATVRAGRSFREANPADDGKYVIFTFKDEDSKEITRRLEVPSDYRDRRNILLHVKHGFVDGKPTFEIVKDGENAEIVHVLKPELIQVVSDFPTKDGWYLTDADGIPIGKEVSDANPDARCLNRLDTYLGLLARGYYNYRYDYYFRRGVDVYVRPSNRFGVLTLVDSRGAVARESA